MIYTKTIPVEIFCSCCNMPSKVFIKIL